MHASWRLRLAPEVEKPYFKDLVAFVQEERRKHTIYPPKGEVFTAFELTPFESVKVVILGQDPYHGPGQAHGLSFSVKPGTLLPPSLVNVLKELHHDTGSKPVGHGHLAEWAEQGVLLLNSVLTVRHKEAGSHASMGWEKFTDAVIRTLDAQEKPVVFLLWGRYARDKASFINDRRHMLLESAHPSPLSAHQGFFGSRPFSKANEALVAQNQSPVRWQLTDTPQPR